MQALEEFVGGKTQILVRSSLRVSQAHRLLFVLNKDKHWCFFGGVGWWVGVFGPRETHVVRNALFRCYGCCWQVQARTSW